MPFSSPIGSTGASNRGSLGETSKSSDSRAVSEGNILDGEQPLGGSPTARKRRSKGPSGFILESNSGPTRQPHRTSSLFSNIPNLIRREHRRSKKYDETKGELDGAGYTPPTQTSPPSRLGISPVPQGTPDSVLIDRRGHLGGAGKESDEISPILSKETDWSAKKPQESIRMPQTSPGNRGHQNHFLTAKNDLDLDAARIINLALNLKESRRRSVNLGRASPGLGANERRSVSMVKPTSRWSSMDGVVISDLRDQLPQDRRASHHASITSSPKPPPRMRRDEDNSGIMRTSIAASKIFPSNDRQDFEHHFSKPTLARAEKAKAAFELAAEYRRLLQFLPPLKPTACPDFSAPSTASASPTRQSFQNPLLRVNSLSSTDGQDERSYNPLQCIRNRQLRMRERQTLDPGADEWGDVTKVREWVDKVGKESRKASFRESHRVLLPPCPSAYLASKHGQSASVTSFRQDENTTPGRWRRPRSEWRLTPEDMFADVYWLEQDDHKELIEDRNGNRIFSLDTNTNIESASHHGSGKLDRLKKFGKDLSGRNSLDTDDRFIKESPMPLVAEPRDHNFIREKHRRQHHHGVQASGADLEKESRRQRDRRHTGDGRSVSSSESDDWRQGRLGGRRSRHRRGDHSLEDLDSAVLEKQMIAMLQKEAEEIESRESGKPRAFSDHATDGKGTGNHPAHSSKLEGPDNQRKTATRRSSLPQTHYAPRSDKREPTGFSTDEMDTTATNSPQGHALRHSSDSVRGLVPNISLSLSSPQTRQGSPERGPQEVKEVLGNHEIEANDFAAADGQTVTPKNGLQPVDSAPITPEKQKKLSATKMLGSRRTNDNDMEDDVLSNSRFRPIKRDRRHPDHSRIRGIFGGGRIEEILRNEVSRIGGFIWKREALPDSSASSSPTSRRNSEQLPSEEDHRGIRKQLTNGTTSTTTSMDNGRLSRVTTGNVPPKYKLPTFTPFSGMNGVVQPPGGPKELDHPNPQQGAHALIQNDQTMTSTNQSDLSLQTSVDLSRTETRNSDFSNINSRRNSRGFRERSKSPSRFTNKGVRDADSRLKTILGMPGGDDTKTSLGTEISTLTSSNKKDRSGSTTEDIYRHWSISGSERPALKGQWNPKDIARLRALLLSSGVRAQGMVRHAERMELLQPSLVEVESDVNCLEVRHNERHRITAQLLTKEIDRNTTQLEDSIQKLNLTIVPNLLKDISSIQDGLSSNLSAEVRKHADEADGVNAKLTSTHIVAIKELNDSINVLIRRRRRRFRWVRRGGYVLLEWTLLGTMWWVWLIVVIIRLFRVTISGIFTGVRWIFWL